MNFDDIIGHKDAVARIRLMLERGNFPHAVLFIGPRRVGKTSVALAAASAILGGAKPESHPDFRRIERGADEKTGKLRKLISVDEVREARTFLQGSAFMGGRKAALVVGAERLSEEAANALLKTLEEPTKSSNVLMTADDAAAVPATVKSRCAVITLRRVHDADLAEALVSRGSTDAEAMRIAGFAAGRPGVALSFREDPDVLDWYATEARRWLAFKDAPLHRRFAIASELAPPGEDREEAVERIREVAAFWEAQLRRELKAGAAVATRLRALLHLRTSLEVNVQPRLLLERFAMELDT
jgi:hypothetical protein